MPIAVGSKNASRTTVIARWIVSRIVSGVGVARRGLAWSTWPMPTVLRMPRRFSP
jgi:hypothetical protein